uniref:Uncharacterized protein n=1 Tax=Arundo donax TaxID=35708 RepID=A0A0A9FR06_ARUDO
MIGGARAGRQN